MGLWRWQAIIPWLDNPNLGAEIGVKEGRFISYLLATFPDLKMYAVDPWENQPGKNETYEGWDWGEIYGAYKQRIAPFEDRVIELQEYSEIAAGHVLDHSLDFVFIDAQHDYQSVKQDIEIWLPKVKPGGLISGHDYQPNFPGVIQAVNELTNDPMLGSNDIWGLRI